MRVFVGLVGLLFVSVSTGELTSETYGLLVFGSGLLLGTVFWRRLL